MSKILHQRHNFIKKNNTLLNWELLLLEHQKEYEKICCLMGENILNCIHYLGLLGFIKNTTYIHIYYIYKISFICGILKTKLREASI